MTEDSRANVTPIESREYHQEAKVASGGKAFVVQHGNLIVYQWKSEYRIEQYDFSVPFRDPAALRVQPSRMLRAQHKVVPFDSERRHKEIEQLTNWRDQAHGLSAVLLHGPGGQGKTRLADHIAEASRNAGWYVLRAVHRGGIPGEEQAYSDLPTTGKSGVMVVIDYAERWPISELLALIQDPILRTQPMPLRFLLVARPAGTWWQAVSYRIKNELQVQTSRIKLEPLAGIAGEWSSVVKAARDAFLAFYDPQQPIAVEIPDAVTQHDYPIVLAAHMAALALVDAAVHERPAPSGSAEITDYLLGRERAYWMELHQADPIRFPTNSVVMGRTVFTATLTRPLSYQEGVAALYVANAIEQGQQVGSVLADHAICYPSGDPAVVLEPLYPDRLGEDFIALTTPVQNASDPIGQPDIDIADPWAARAIHRLLGADTGESPTWLPAAMSTLVETAGRWPHIAEEQLFPIVREYPQMMLLAGGAAVVAFSELPTVPVDLLEAIERMLPAGRGTEFAIGRSAVTERLAKIRLAYTKDPAQQAAIYGRLRRALSNAGLHGKERVAVEEEVRLYRMLARADPEAFVVPLAIALDAYSTTMTMNGDFDASIMAGNEAVTIYSRLYSVNPGTFSGELARTLTNLGNTLLRKHLLNEALQTQQAAVRIRRSINRDLRVVSDDLGLAGALVQLSVTLSHHGRLPEALDLIEEAVDLFRSLTGSGELNSEQGVYAHALEIKARILILMNMFAEAIQPLTEAIEIFRPLAISNPAVHDGLLAQSLSQLGVCFLNLERAAEGIEALQESVDIFSRLPGGLGVPRIEPNYIGMLCNLGNALIGNGEAEAAVSILADAVEKSRILLESDSHEVLFLPWALHSLAFALSILGDSEAALSASEESERIYRELASADEGAYSERWYKARYLLAHILDVLGRQEDASAMRPAEP
jgi:tetratricopeptide (TPR) repeat protein